MTTEEIAQSFIKAYTLGHIYNLTDMATEDIDDNSSCDSECDECPAACHLLSEDSTSYSSFLVNYSKILNYIKLNYPEYLL